MNQRLKKTIAFSFFLLFYSISVAPTINSIEMEKINNYPFDIGKDNELVLLRGEHFLYLDAVEYVESFNVKYSFPPEYGSQYPVFLDIVNDSNTNRFVYKIENDTFEPNKFINFTIDYMNKDEQILIHFNYWVLVKNNNFSDFPKFISIPSIEELPEETKTWLIPTDTVQSDRFLIKIRAIHMRFLRNNLLNVANRIAKFSKWHRYFLFLIQFYTGRYKSQDAFTTLIRNGECPGRSHLGCALFRANGVPARVILAVPDYEFWYEIHCMTEYYLPDYGWVLTDVHSAKTPFEPKYQIICRICYPEDENNTHIDYLYSKMYGVENWFWITNDSVVPYYEDLNKGSKSRGFTENDIFVNNIESDDAITVTKEVFKKFEYFLKFDLYGENLKHFEQAKEYQMIAINRLSKEDDACDYIYYMSYANAEYEKIEL
jgi:hypothetical protein